MDGTVFFSHVLYVTLSSVLVRDVTDSKYECDGI